MFKFNKWWLSMGMVLLFNSNNILAFQEANLPNKSEIKPTRVMPIDGVWTISSIDKRIKIDRGRAYAIDSWAHLGLFEIKKGMVVIKDIKKKAVSNYTGYDLPLLGGWNAFIQSNRNMKVNVGLVSYELIPERLKSRQAYEDEMVMAGLIEKASDSDSEEDYQADDEDYSEESEESEEYVEDSDDESEDYSEDDGYDEDDQFAEDDQFIEDEEYLDDEDEEYLDEEDEDWSEEEEEGPKKVKAKIMGPLRVGCVGKQNYLSKGACWSCPSGYKRFSPTRKMSHAKACKERGFGFNKKTTKAKKLWSPAVGCPKGQFGHLNKCKKCPKGTKRIGLVGFDSGNCKYINLR